MINVEVACEPGALEDEILLKIEEFNRARQKEKNCLPLTDYEKMLLAQFLRSLIT